MKKFLFLLLPFLAACSHSGSGGNTGGGGGVIVPPPGWTAYFGTTQGQRCDDFDFPTSGSINYCVNGGLRPLVGQTISMTFTISGQVVPVEAADIPPASLRLFIWRAGDNLSCGGVYQQYRIWSNKVDLIPGTQTITARLSGDNWTDCYGQSPSPAIFQDILNNLAGVGYTFGGQYFAGHGVRANGSAHFTLNNFSFGNQKHKKKRR